MSNMKQEDVESIAAKYAESIGVAPFLIDGSDFDESDSPPIWRVYIGLVESSETDIGLPNFMVIRVDDTTGTPSHTDHL